MPKKMDIENMTADEMRAYLEQKRAYSNEKSKEWYRNHREQHKEYQRKYMKTLAYARTQAAYWAKKVLELEEIEEMGTEINE